MAAGRACHMALKPRINAVSMKGMHAVIENARILTLFDRILADGAVLLIVLCDLCNLTSIHNLLSGWSYHHRIHKVLKRIGRRNIH